RRIDRIERGPECRPQLGVVRLRGQLQRRRLLQRQLEPPAGAAADRDRGDVGGGGRGEPARGRRSEPRRLPQPGVVCRGGQLRRRRHIRRQLRQLTGGAAERDRGDVGDGGRGGPARERRIEALRRPQLGVVCLGGQLLGRRLLHRQP